LGVYNESVPTDVPASEWLNRGTKGHVLGDPIDASTSARVAFVPYRSAISRRRARLNLPRPTGPAAIVWGKSDPILGRVLARIERLLPDASVTATAAGHFLQEQVPGAIAEAIRGVAKRASTPPGRAKPRAVT
jgi:pimeloyl-ACP methyl ester carboxylesterase